MKINARQLSRLVLEVVKDTHGRFDTSDVDADLDASDPTMLDPDTAIEIDEGHDDSAPRMSAALPEEDASYVLHELAGGVAHLLEMVDSIESSPAAMARLNALQTQVSEAIDEIEEMAALDDERQI